MKASLRGRIFDKADRREKRPIAVGDRVRFQVEGDEAVVVEVLPRRTTLCRLSSGDEKKQVVAANVDQAAVVASLRKPEPYPPLLDRILAGTLVDVGRGRIPEGAVPGILATRDRRAAGITAPGKGLFLHWVRYPEAFEVPLREVKARGDGLPAAGLEAVFDKSGWKH